tara:strand:+ start:3217 stop:3594 length:378 start_codon:yes stop_codon:yes gene_type:complete
MAHILWVGAGGFVGSVARYLLVNLAQSTWPNSFPIGTLLVNATGCLAIGSLSTLLENQPVLSSEVRSFLFIGILGSFTTFSAFGHETVTLLRHAGIGTAVANVSANILLSIGGVLLGRAAAQLAE